MRDALSPAFLVTTAGLHAGAVALAGLGSEAWPAGARLARWAVALIYIGSVVHLALRRGEGWTTAALVGPPIALGAGMAAGMIVLLAAWNGRPGSALLVLTACMLPALGAAVAAPAIGAIARHALGREERPAQ